MKRRPIKTIEFNKRNDERGRFANLYDAWAWCKQNGYSYGQTCRDMPICLMKGEYDWIAKWKNLTSKEQNESDGLIIKTTGDNYAIVIYNA